MNPQPNDQNEVAFANLTNKPPAMGNKKLDKTHKITNQRRQNVLAVDDNDLNGQLSLDIENRGQRTSKRRAIPKFLN